MSRIFLSLSALSTLLIGIAFVLGVRIGNVNKPYQEFLQLREQIETTSLKSLPNSPEIQALQKRKTDQGILLGTYRPRITSHTTFGILAAIVTMLIHSVCVTYFIGTAKWCGEVVGAYQLSQSLYQECCSLKRGCFRWSLLGIGTILLVVVLGASSDPGTLQPNTWHWVEPHLWAASIGLAVTLLAFWKQWDYLLRNVQIVQQVQDEVQQVRAAHGLD